MNHDQYEGILDGLLKTTTLSSTFDDFCRRATHHLLKPLRATGLLVATIESDDSMHLKGSYGVAPKTATTTRIDDWRTTGIAIAIDGGEQWFCKNPKPDLVLGPGAKADWQGNTWAIFMPFSRYELAIGGICILAKQDPLDLENWVEADLVNRAAELLCSKNLRHSPRQPERQTLGSADSGELSSRETRILELLEVGLTNARIGKELHLSESSIKQELGRIYKKLGVSNRTDAITLWSGTSKR